LTQGRAAAVLLLAIALFSPVQAATLHVVNHGWHSGLVIRRGDIPEGLWPEHRQAPPGEYLEIGWGERRFYQTRDPSLLQALTAALWPSPSVLHLVGFNGPVTRRYPPGQIIVLQVDAAGMARRPGYPALIPVTRCRVPGTNTSSLMVAKPACRKYPTHSAMVWARPPLP
jgi:hypothetical protein